MALRTLMLKKRLDDKRKELETLRAVDFSQREAELEKSIEETTTDEERSFVDSEIEKFEAERTAHDASVRELETEVENLEKELDEIEEKNDAEPEAKPEARTEEKKVEVRTMESRTFFGMNIMERDALFAREDVKAWLQNTREIMSRKETRGVSGGAYTIPQVVLPLVYSEVDKSSKLRAHVSETSVPGTTRQVIAGAVPEGVWTEMCGTINEGAISFTNIELDGFKVGCFIPVCNALLEDSDIALASEIISMLGQGLGYALDKAIVFGTGTKMPTGMAVGTGLVKISLSGKTGKALFAAMLKGCGSMKHELGELVWIMNRTTHLAIMAETVEFNSAAALVASANSTMPVVGGAIVELDFVKDNEIIVGYGKRYKLARRADIRIAQSTEVKFIEDQTVFKATARYDGKPVFADAFMAFGLTGAPTAALDTNHPFAADTANTPAQSAGGAG